MIYQYWCKNCAVFYDILQGADDEHKYVCPECLQECGRVWTAFEYKKNEPFFSYTLPSGADDHPGRWVSGHTEFEQELQKTRYLTDCCKGVGDNSKPKDEWVELREKNLDQERKESQQRIDLMREYNAKIEEGRIQPPKNC